MFCTYTSCYVRVRRAWDLIESWTKAYSPATYALLEPGLSQQDIYSFASPDIYFVFIILYDHDFYLIFFTFCFDVLYISIRRWAVLRETSRWM